MTPHEKLRLLAAFMECSDCYAEAEVVVAEDGRPVLVLRHRDDCGTDEDRAASDHDAAVRQSGLEGDQ